VLKERSTVPPIPKSKKIKVDSGSFLGTNPNKLPKGTQNFQKCTTFKAQSDGKKKKRRRRRRRDQFFLPANKVLENSRSR
jgi:hypothetical protein